MIKRIEDFSHTDEFKSLERVIETNAPEDYGGLRMFNGERDYLMQIPREFAATICFLRSEFKDRKLCYLEIGTASNLANTMLWNNLNIDKNIILDNLCCTNSEKSLVRNLAFKNGTIFIVGDSTSNKVKENFSRLDFKLDLIFCDGNHEYEYVKNDFNFYSKFLKSGGFFIFHDTDSNRYLGVKKFINEIEMNDIPLFKKSGEFIDSSKKNRCGIEIYKKL
ncbi:hypothetical protein CL614_06745 [archaeon]|nr:hypothetical protein [archaeon]|tara:strand:+ start:7156 stop:7818 length:663 start_codon:yes stop_codon:yes gene_type:complete